MAAVCRQWARAQRHTENCQREWLADRVVLESELVRLRGALLVLHTAWLWGLPPQSHLWPKPSRPSTPSTSPESATPTSAATTLQTLCRVGCQGHGHPWLDEQGQCRLQGRACASVTAAPTVTTAPSRGFTGSWAGPFANPRYRLTQTAQRLRSTMTRAQASIAAGRVVACHTQARRPRGVAQPPLPRRAVQTPRPHLHATSSGMTDTRYRQPSRATHWRKEFAHGIIGSEVGSRKNCMTD